MCNEAVRSSVHAHSGVVSACRIAHSSNGNSTCFCFTQPHRNRLLLPPVRLSLKNTSGTSFSGPLLAAPWGL